MSQFYEKARSYHDKERYNEALALYQTGAREGDVRCYYGIALDLWDGKTQPADQKAASLIFATHFTDIKQLADEGDTAAMTILCFYYYNAFPPVQEDKPRAIKYLCKAAEEGYVVAQRKLASLYENGDYFEKDLYKSFAWRKKAAEQGDANAQCELGIAYYLGEGVEQNAAQAAEWYAKATAQGHAGAQWRLGHLYEHGEGVEKDPAEAARLFRQSARQGDSIGQWRLGSLYDRGHGVPQNHAKAAKYFQMAAEQGDSEAQWRLGVLYEYGRGIEKSLEKAVEYYRLAAEQGDGDGQWRLGTMYEFGIGIPENKAIAAEWYAKAAEQGDPHGQWRLGILYEYGDGGLKKDVDKAMEWYLKASLQDLPFAQWCLGTVLEDKNLYEDAVKWYTRSAEQGDPNGQYRLAYAYEFGTGVEKDPSIALEWYRKAAEQDEDESQYRLGLLYEYGIGTEKKMVTATHWYRRAASLGNAKAQRQLGICYEFGVGEIPSPNLQKALKWYQKAAENEYPDAEAACRLGYAYYDGNGVKRDLNTAKHWFGLALERGFSCEPVLDMIRSELGEKLENQTKDYAEQLLQKKLSAPALYGRVQKDLCREFGSTWEMLETESQQMLTTGMICYILLHSTGENNCGNLDFSCAITPMFKALERELGRFFCTRYLRWLKENNVPFQEFSGDRIFIKTISKFDHVYRDPEDLSTFKLGSLGLFLGAESKVIGPNYVQVASEDKRKYKTHSGKHVKTVDATVLRFLKDSMREDVFGNLDDEREITDYLFYLLDTVSILTDRFRNPAAHRKVMSSYQAEECANYLIKGHQLLKKFLEKLLPPPHEPPKRKVAHA